MAIKAQAQQTLIDMTDAYSVILTSEAYTFPGTTAAAKAGTCTTQVLAYRGKEQVACSIGTMTCPTGVSAAKDSNATSPTITVTATTSFTTPGEVQIPVSITGTDIVINKKLSLAIAFTGSQGETGATGAAGKGISSTNVTYQASSSGTTIPTGTWSTSIPTVAAGQYLWTKTVFTYTDTTTATAYSVGMMGATGASGSKGETGATGATGKGISSTAITYQAGSSGTTAPTGTWSSSIPAVSASQYLWTRTVITYSDSTTSTAYSVGMMGETGPTGATGQPGADAIVLSITSSNGLIFKNTDISTTLTAHVYQGGVELTSAQISALGTIKWYKDGSTTVAATGATLTISSGDVTNKADYIATLEG
jgi:hypothetical protein